MGNPVSYENQIDEELISALSSLDSYVGSIKREATESDSFTTGATVEGVAEASIEKAQEFARTLLELHGKEKGPLFLGKDKFKESLQYAIANAFSYFAQYCHTVVEETSVVTNQKHMYEKQYRTLHQTLDSLSSELNECMASKNA